MPVEPIRVMIAEDSPVTSRALEELLADVVDEFSLVGVAVDAGRAVDLARATQPDVALLDVRMPGGGGPVATLGIRDVSPTTQILAYSVADDRESVVAMLRAGARGYLLKGTGASDLLAGLRSCAQGGTTLSADLSQHLMTELTEQAERHLGDSQERRHREHRIRELLSPTGIQPVYQPIIDLRSSAVVGYEALARFSDGRPPDEVFRDAYEVQLGTALELHAARIQVDTFRRAQAHVQGRYLAVNASAGLLASSVMADILEPRAGEGRVVELTEHSDEDMATLQLAIGTARSRSLRVAIDDTGAGFSGLQRIVTVCPDILKLDRSLVTGLHQDRSKRALVAALARYCAEMRSVIVAEGIETEDELDTLRSLGVTHGQGYLLGRPAPLPSEC